MGALRGHEHEVSHGVPDWISEQKKNMTEKARAFRVACAQLTALQNTNVLVLITAL